MDSHKIDVVRRYFDTDKDGKLVLKEEGKRVMDNFLFGQQFELINLFMEEMESAAGAKGLDIVSEAGAKEGEIALKFARLSGKVEAYREVRGMMLNWKSGREAEKKTDSKKE